VRPWVQSLIQEKEKRKENLPYDPAIPTGHLPKEYKSSYNKDTCTFMFIKALFTIAKLWHQPRCPSTCE
jgi:hypothetical protein